jgi:hypothetical protein
VESEEALMEEDKASSVGADDTAFQTLEKDFQEVSLWCAEIRAASYFTLTQVLSELMGDQSLEKFRVEYEKLHRALKKSHESEKRLMQKCRELNSEIMANAAKVTTALKISQEDKTTISSMKQV